jgi:hypothetical protein
MTDQVNTTSEIRGTTDYAKFKTMLGNRNINRNHVLRLMEEMRRYPDIFATQPILVNKDFYIVDGQHRFQAAHELGVPVYYTILENANLDTARHLNVAQRGWGLVDFARSYAETGRKDYVTFMRTLKQYPQIPPASLALVLAGSERKFHADIFRRGDFAIPDLDVGMAEAEQLARLISKTGVKLNTPFARALHRLNKSEDYEFDFDHFVRKLDSSGIPLENQANVKNVIRMIEDIYNWRSANPVHFY